MLNPDFIRGTEPFEKYDYIVGKSMGELIEKLKSINIPTSLIQILYAEGRYYAVVQFDRKVKIERKKENGKSSKL